MKKHVYRKGEYAFLAPKGEIVTIIGSTTKEGWVRTKTLIRVASLKDLDPITGKFTQYYDCNSFALLPILDEDVQFLLKMTYSSKKFNLVRQI